jgi:hypothetical protein
MTKGLHLDEALVRVSRPEAGGVTYPFRPRLEEGRVDRAGTSGYDPREGGSDTPAQPRASTSAEAFRVDGGLSTASQPDARTGMVPSKKKGILVPRHSRSIKKYDALAVPKIVRKFLGLKRASTSGLPPSCVKLLSCKIARATWGRYAAAVKIWKRFSDEKGGVTNVSFENSRVEFIGWCASKRDLAPSTVRTYLGALKNLFQLKIEWAAGKGELLEKSLLKGLENIRGQTNQKRKARKTIPVSLKILGNVKRSLRLQNWAQGSKICVWAACLVAFWGVFRLGELLPKSELKFDKSSDLLWSDVRISKREKGGILLKVRGCKVRGNPGNSARLFNLEKKEFCPVAALEALKNSQKPEGCLLWKILSSGEHRVAT